MLSVADFTMACSTAREEAGKLSKDLDSSEFFDQDKDDKSGYARVIARLKHFIHRTCRGTLILHLTYDDVPGFASWLVRSGNGTGGIALYVTQMVKWAAKTKMPLHVQKIRSIIHELGHIKLSPHLLQNTLPPAPRQDVRRSPYASPFEEEMAWVFACAFMGFFLGDYSFNSRKDHARDDAPRFFI